MNFVNSKTAKIFTSISVIVLLTGFDWKVDWSRRQVDFDRVQNQSRMPSSQSPVSAVPEEEEVLGLLPKMAEPVEVSQDIVIMNTENGFVPSSLKLRKGGRYTIHLVNVNTKQKNVSFVMDAFSEAHSMYYGVVKTFTITPKVDGLFTYQCPEGDYQGKLVIFSDKPYSPKKSNAPKRSVASEKKAIPMDVETQNETESVESTSSEVELRSH